MKRLLVAFCFIVACFLLPSCRYGRMWETPGVRPHEEPIIETHAGTVPLEDSEALLKASDPKTLLSPFGQGDEEVVKAGEKLYGLFCAQCHGKNHDGNGTVGQSFQPLPTDIRSPEAQAKMPGELFYTISYGVPDGRQPALATTIEIGDRWRIVTYVKSLGIRQ